MKSEWVVCVIVWQCSLVYNSNRSFLNTCLLYVFEDNGRDPLQAIASFTTFYWSVAISGILMFIFPDYILRYLKTLNIVRTLYMLLVVQLVCMGGIGSYTLVFHENMTLEWTSIAAIRFIQGVSGYMLYILTGGVLSDMYLRGHKNLITITNTVLPVAQIFQALAPSLYKIIGAKHIGYVCLVYSVITVMPMCTIWKIHYLLKERNSRTDGGSQENLTGSKEHLTGKRSFSMILFKHLTYIYPIVYIYFLKTLQSFLAITTPKIINKREEADIYSYVSTLYLIIMAISAFVSSFAAAFLLDIPRLNPFISVTTGCIFFTLGYLLNYLYPSYQYLGAVISGLGEGQARVPNIAVGVAFYESAGVGGNDAATIASNLNAVLKVLASNTGNLIAGSIDKYKAYSTVPWIIGVVGVFCCFITLSCAVVLAVIRSSNRCTEIPSSREDAG